ncbi:FAD-dependent monooxygenase [Nocardia sp. NPDC055053]
MRSVKTDVLVVGAGPAGLTASAFLAKYGVDAITLSRHPGTAPQPRATIMNQRTVEVLRDLGIEQEIDRIGVRLADQSHSVYATSFVGAEILRYRAYGAADRATDYQLASPSANYNVGQHYLEPLVLTAARQHGADVRFNHELVSLVQAENDVVARVRERESGEEYEVRAMYVVGADGGRSRVAEQVGAEFEGEASLLHMVSAWLEVDLTEHTAYRPCHIYTLLQPGGDSWVGSGSFLNVRPWNEWVLSRQYDGSLGDPDRSDEAVIAAARSLIGDPDIPVKVKGTGLWQVNNMVAKQYGYGRVFLVGDAAHRHPPAGGLGSNTSVQDAFNLAWKLAFVLSGRAGIELLDSYHDERQPVGKHMVTRTMENLGYMAAVGKTLGLVQGQSSAEGWAALKEISCNTEAGVKRREDLAQAIELQHYRSSAHGTDIGHRYTESCGIVDDGTPFPEPLRDPELFYQPTTHPGAYLPHAWLERDRERMSTLDLAGHGRFSLIIGIGGEQWVQAAHSVEEELGIELPVFAVGYHCEYDDVLGDWAKVREIDDHGALLIRPDRHIAWRSATCPEAPIDSLLDAVRQALARSMVGVT